MNRLVPRLLILAVLAALSPAARGQGFGPPRTPTLETSSIVIATSKSGRTLHAYSAHTGKWESIKVANPEAPRKPPVLGGAIGHVVVGNTVYAFSGTTGRWLAREFPEEPTPLDFGPRLAVKTGSTLHQFSALTGTWSSLDLDADAQD